MIRISAPPGGAARRGAPRAPVRGGPKVR